MAASRQPVLRAPRSAAWWIAALFAVGSSCFLVGPFPGFVELVGSAVDGAVFFVGSVFFTSAAALQWLETLRVDASGTSRGRRLVSWEPHRLDWWSSGVQFIGTLSFNVTTFRAMATGLGSAEYDRLVWAPDAFGSVCFLVSGFVAYAAVCGRPICRPRWTLDSVIATVNLAGCVAFGVAAVAGYVVPSTGSALDLAASNAWTALGGLCFLVGSLLLFAEPVPARGTTSRSRHPRWRRADVTDRSSRRRLVGVRRAAAGRTGCSA